MYGVLFQSYADKVSFYRSKPELISRLSERKNTYVTEFFFVWENILMYVKERESLLEYSRCHCSIVLFPETMGGRTPSYGSSH